jgi:hypothetical protein
MVLISFELSLPLSLAYWVVKVNVSTNMRYMLDDAMLRHPVGNHKRKVWGAHQQVSLSCETKVIEPVGESQTSEGDAC